MGSKAMTEPASSVGRAASPLSTPTLWMPQMVRPGSDSRKAPASRPMGVWRSGVSSSIRAAATACTSVTVTPALMALMPALYPSMSRFHASRWPASKKPETGMVRPTSPP